MTNDRAPFADGRAQPFGHWELDVFGWLRLSVNILALTACLLAPRPTLGAETPAPSEYQVKAAILFNLTKYVDWPAASFAQADSPMVLGILGQDNFGDDLKGMVEGKTVNGRKLVLKRMTWDEDMKSAHLLFVCASEKRRLPEILGKLKGASVLTVGESDTFTELGGMINLAKKDHRIRPEVNLVVAERAHLKISSKLLSISDLVKGKLGGKQNP